MRVNTILPIFLFMLLSFLALASAKSSVSDALESLSGLTNSYEDVSIVYGDGAAIEDLRGSFMVSDIFPLIDKDLGRGPYIKKSSEISSFKNKNLILVGGPCANKISEEITNEKGYNCNDWKFGYERAVVKVFDNGNGKAIMIAGTTKEDTLKMADAIRRYDKMDKLKSSDEVIFETPVGSQCGNNICETKETDASCPADCLNEGSVQLTSGLRIRDFDVSGNYVAFEDKNESVYVQNLETKEMKKIGRGSWPKIDGDYITYSSTAPTYNEDTGDYVDWPVIKLYKISTGKIIQLTKPKTGYYFEWPIISGNKVVWLERNEIYENNNTPKLMIYDIEKKSTKKLVDVRNYWDGNFKMDGNYIVYEGPKFCIPEDCSTIKLEISPRNFVYKNAKEGDQDIWLYDISEDKKTRITSNKKHQVMPEIWNHYVVWVDDSSISTEYSPILETKKMEKNIKIYVYDILTGEEKPLNLTYVVPGGSHTAISFSDYNIVWTDYRNSNQTSTNEDVYLYNLQGDTERRITLNSGHQGGAVIDGNHIVWIDSRNKNSTWDAQDLYMFKLN